MEKLILLWLPLQGDVQCRHISPESYIVIICKLISTCDLMRRGFSLGWLETICLKDVVPSQLRGKLLYHCTVWQANYKWRLNPDTYCLLVTFHHTQTTITIWQMTLISKDVPWGLRRHSAIIWSTTTKSIQPDRLKTTMTEEQTWWNLPEILLQKLNDSFSVWIIFEAFFRFFCPGLTGGRQWLHQLLVDDCQEA